MMIELDEKHANELLDMTHSYRRIAAEMGTCLTVKQEEAFIELKYECASARKAALRKANAA
jgi:hypothetical protein